MSGNNVGNNGLIILAGKILGIAAICVTAPLVVLAILSATGHGVSHYLEQQLLTFSAIGFSVVGTGGNALIGSALFTQGKHRVLLTIAWLIQIAGVVFIVSTYLKMISLRDKTDADGVIYQVSLLAYGIPWEWAQNLYFVCIVLVPEITLVAGMVVVMDLIGVRDVTAELREEINDSRHETRNAKLEMEKLEAMIDEKVEEKVVGRMSEIQGRFERRFEK